MSLFAARQNNPPQQNPQNPQGQPRPGPQQNGDPQPNPQNPQPNPQNPQQGNPPQQTPPPNAIPQQPSASANSSSVLNIPATAAAGGILMTQPPQTATSFYKIAPSQIITFGWNMTSVLATPTHLTVSAVCENGNTYPVGPTDGIIPGTATQVVWDINSYQSANPNMPLGQGTCTLNIWDERGPGVAGKGGYLSPFNGLHFALYTPQAYTALASGWQCPECKDNGGVMSTAAHPAFVGTMVSFLVILLSGFHMLRANHH